MNPFTLNGIELVKANTIDILRFSQEHKGERLLVVFHEEKLHSIETFEEAHAHLKYAPLDVPFNKLIEGMDKAKANSSETAVVLTFITVKGVDDDLTTANEEEFEISCGVMSCELCFLQEEEDKKAADPERLVNTTTRGQA